MRSRPQNLAPSFSGALFIARLLKGLARLLGFPIAQPVPVTVHRPNRRIALMALALLLLPGSGISAETIKLQNDTVIDADVLRTDDDGIVIRLPRSAIRTINDAALPAVLQTGVKAPQFLATDLLGQAQAIGGAEGKATLVHFWVSWCQFCQADAPHLQDLATRYQDNPDIRIITVSLDEHREVLEQFLTDHHVTYPVVMAAAQPATPQGISLPELYQIQSFPVTYLIDSHGIIRHKFSGSFAKANVDLAPLISALLPSLQKGGGKAEWESGTFLQRKRGSVRVARLWPTWELIL